MADSLPDFLFIGPDKTGSSWIYEILQQHPQCFIPEAKDLYFFDRYYHFGIKWYKKFFRPAQALPVRAAGELSHDYLFSEKAAERIQKHLPDVRLVTCLRDPVERTFSHYLYLVRSGLTSAPFREALEDFPELINNSRYATHLQMYIDRFPREQLLILDFDDLRADPREFAQQLFEFLGLDYVEHLAYEKKVLSAEKPRSGLVARVMKTGANLARRLGLANLVGRIKRGTVKKLVYTSYSDSERPVLSAADRQFLQQTFQPEMDELRQLLGTQVNQFGDWISSVQQTEQV